MFNTIKQATEELIQSVEYTDPGDFDEDLADFEDRPCDPNILHEYARDDVEKEILDFFLTKGATIKYQDLADAIGENVIPRDPADPHHLFDYAEDAIPLRDLLNELEYVTLTVSKGIEYIVLDTDIFYNELIRIKEL